MLAKQSSFLGSVRSLITGIAAVKQTQSSRMGLASPNVKNSFWEQDLFKRALSKLICIGIKGFSFESPAMQDRFGVSRRLGASFKNKIAGSLKGNGCVKIICHWPVERIALILSVNNRCHFLHDFHGKLL